MEALLDDLAAQHAELDALLRGLTNEQWDAPTPCEGWSVADVVVHLQQTDELALAALRGEIDPSIETMMRAGDDAVDAAAAASVAGARGASGAVVGEQWRRSATALRDSFAAAAAHDRVQWIVGTLSVHTLAATRLAEGWIHATDVAAALGTEVEPTDRLRHVARLAWRTIPYAFERAGRTAPGSVGFDLVGPSGAAWRFGMDEEPATIVRGPGSDLCLVAGRRREPAAAALVATGPDAVAVLELVRTYA